MGFFDWLLGEKTDKKKSKQVDKYANFNLHERVEGSNAPVSNNTGFDNYGFQGGTDTVMFSPKSHKEVQEVVDCLKSGKSAMVDLSNISGEDSMRILDFLSGAVYGINGSITRWKDDSFFIAPEGHKILRKE